MLWLIKDVSKKKQNKFAEEIGISPQTVNSWIQNERFPTKREHLEKLRMVLGVNINWLVTGQGPPYLYDKPSEKTKKVQVNTTEKDYIVRYEIEEQKYVDKLLGILRSDYEHAKVLVKTTIDILSKKPDCTICSLNLQQWINAGRPERRKEKHSLPDGVSRNRRQKKHRYA